jgi:hypothetical protein
MVYVFVVIFLKYFNLSLCDYFRSQVPTAVSR